MFNIFYYKNNICIIITFSNLTKKSEIECIFTKRFHLPYRNIIFSSNYVSKSELLSSINLVKKNVKNNASIKFSEKNFN